MTWSQKLIAKLIEIHGTPEWTRWESFATAEFKHPVAESVNALIYAGMPGNEGHANMEVMGDSRSITIFTDPSDAPDDCEVG